MKLLLLLLFIPSIFCAPKVLLLPHPFVVSHVRLFYNLASQLLTRGYNVTILHWPAGRDTADLPKPKGAHVIHYAVSQHEWVQETIDNMVWKTHDVYMDYIRFMARGTELAMRPCVLMERNTELVRRLRSEEFSLAIVDPQTYPCSWVIANRLRVPYVTVTPSVPIYYVTRASRTPVPMSYVPSIIADRTDRMSFLGRAINVIDHGVLSCSSYWYLIIYWFKMLSWIRNPEPWTNVEHSPLMTLQLTNTLLEFPRPISLTHVNMGLKQRVKQAVIDDLIAQSDDTRGSIIFSLTTLGDKERMSSEMKAAFEGAFDKFPDYKIIWRTVQKPLPVSGNPNILYTSWFNQTNLFAHAKTKLLITHGGIATVLEATRHGIPMLGMPMAFDHHANIARIVSKGMGLKILKREITAKAIYSKISAILESRDIALRTELYRKMFDSEQEAKIDNPLLWWTEYAARHGKILESLRAKGEMLWSPLYYGLDCFTVIFVIILLISKI